jgi:hypothetical protein
MLLRCILTALDEVRKGGVLHCKLGEVLCHSITENSLSKEVTHLFDEACSLLVADSVKNQCCILSCVNFGRYGMGGLLYVSLHCMIQEVKEKLISVLVVLKSWILSHVYSSHEVGEGFLEP